MSIIIPHAEARINFGVAGRMTFELSKAAQDGSVIPGTTVPVAGLCGNLITNGGMDNIGITAFSSANDSINFAAVSTDATAPQFTDTTLVGEVARTTTTVGGNTLGVSYDIVKQLSVSPTYYTVWRKFRFAAGAAQGNLTKVAILNADTTAYSIALIVDEFGVPTSLPVGADDILDVKYEYKIFIPEVDVTGQITIKGTPINWTLRPTATSSLNIGTTDMGWPAFGAGDTNQIVDTVALRGPRARLFFFGANSGAASTAVAAGATLVAADQKAITTQAPSARSADVKIAPAYTPGSFSLSQTAEWGIDRGNHAALNMLVMSPDFGSFQIAFATPFEKLATERMRFTLTTTWSRA